MDSILYAKVIKVVTLSIFRGDAQCRGVKFLYRVCKEI